MEKSFNDGEIADFAITHKQEQYLIGSVGLIIHKNYKLTELGYWIGVDYWRNGYCTEAAKKMLEYGFNDLNLNRIQSYHFDNNPASGEVMKKIGMKYEGCRRQAILKWDRFYDRVMYGILKRDFS